MKIYGTSDIHLDINPLRFALGDRKEDILLLAGDNAEVASFFPRYVYLDGMPENKTPENCVLMQSPVAEDFRKICAAYKYVVVIFGNHEFYHGNLKDSVQDFRDLFKDVDNLIILDNQTIVIENAIRIIGTTLWTDINNGNPQYMQYLRHYMNDYNHIKTYRYMDGMVDGVRTLMPSDTTEKHAEDRAFLAAELENIAEDDPIPTIVMTHHAPVWTHRNSQRSGNDADYGYACTDMDDIVLDNDKKVFMWFHGHTHDERLTKVGNTMVATHARGYYERQFTPMLLLDLDK